MEKAHSLNATSRFVRMISLQFVLRTTSENLHSIFCLYPKGFFSGVYLTGFAPYIGNRLPKHTSLLFRPSNSVHPLLFYIADSLNHDYPRAPRGPPLKKKMSQKWHYSSSAQVV